MPVKPGDRGTAAIELVLGVTLILIPMAMVVLSLAPLLETRTFIRQAAADTPGQIASGVTDEARALDALEVVRGQQWCRSRSTVDLTVREPGHL